MRRPILIDLSHTSHTAARTGVQRVALGLRDALDGDAWEITYDPFARRWRGLEDWEWANLAGTAQRGKKRGAHWPWTARWRGRLRRALQGVNSFDCSGTGNGFAVYPRSGPETLPRSATFERCPPRGLVVPEIFSAEVGAALPALLAEVDGPRVAVFHDAIALRLPELAPPKVVARFPAYLRELAQFDGIAAVSEASRAELLGYWEWAGVWETPPVVAIPLGVELVARVVPNALDVGPRTASLKRVGPARRSLGGGGDNARHQLLSVGTIEGRKNHIALLEACELLWQRGLKFDLHLIGRAQHQTGAAALALIEKLQRAGRPLRYDDSANDEALEAAYAAAAFTVYPSLAEGFGLPVAESLVRGKPCICSAQGALGEISTGGGCLTVPEPTALALAAACARLLEDPRELSALTALARARIFPTPAEHARRLQEWMDTLGR